VLYCSLCEDHSNKCKLSAFEPSNPHNDGGPSTFALFGDVFSSGYSVGIANMCGFYGTDHRADSPDITGKFARIMDST
jgi:hypothetical protein